MAVHPVTAAGGSLTITLRHISMPVSASIGPPRAVENFYLADVAPAPYPCPMTKNHDLLASGPTVSFEFFPPATDEALRSLVKNLGVLAELGPSFVSVTYGAS